MYHQFKDDMEDEISEEECSDEEEEEEEEEEREEEEDEDEDEHEDEDEAEKGELWPLQSSEGGKREATSPRFQEIRCAQSFNRG